MGAWYVFASVGLYPMVPGVGGFSINSPQFDEVKISLPKGELIIKGGSTDEVYIKSLKWNGKNYNSTWIDWTDIKNGGTFEFKTSKKIVKNWGQDIQPPSYK